MTETKPAGLSLSRTVEAELREKGSRFVATIAPAASVEECRALLDAHRQQYRDATHVCSAWRVLEEAQLQERASDDGEPAGTAGQAMLRQLRGEGMTMILATHEMNFARELADRICFMENGVIVESGPPAQIFGQPKEPRTQAFLKSILN